MSTPAVPATRTASLPRLVAASCLAGAVAAAINALLAVGAVAAFGIPATFEPLGLPAVVIASVVGALGAGAGFAVLSRCLRRPVPAFLAVAGAVLVASMYPPIDLALSDPPRYPGASVAAVSTLMLMHVVVALISAALLVRGLPLRQSRGGTR